MRPVVSGSLGLTRNGEGADMWQAVAERGGTRLVRAAHALPVAPVPGCPTSPVARIPHRASRPKPAETIAPRVR